MEAITRLAIEAFNTLERRKASVEKAEENLHKLAGQIPDKDMPEYMNYTERIIASRDK